MNTMKLKEKCGNMHIYGNDNFDIVILRKRPGRHDIVFAHKYKGNDRIFCSDSIRFDNEMTDAEVIEKFLPDFEQAQANAS